MKESICAALSKVDHVCTTADIWSSNNRSFLGITAHWIDPDTLERRSAALCCERMKGRHTYDCIAVRLNAVHTAYRINNKVLMTVTDNGSNFVKAFKEFANDGSVVSDDDDNNVAFVDVDALLSEPEHDEDSDLYLPPHQRCAAHTLNLIASHDIESANSDAVYKKLSRSTMAKCSALWNKTSRSTQFADIVRDKFHTSFIVPNATRWNSYFNAVDKVRQVLEKQSEDNIAEVFVALEVPQFRPNDILFLKEYCCVMQPLAAALDILQAETKCFIGFLLPTLMSLRTKLLTVKPTLKLAAPLLTAVLSGLDKRFQGYDERHDLIIASVTLPQFRMRWIDNNDRKKIARSLLYDELQAAKQQQQVTEPDTDDKHESGAVSDDEFFSFANEPRDNVDAAAELDLYLSDNSREIACLQKYPSISKLFKKFNTPLPSSAPVERLFSLGGQILVPRRNRMTDEHFERQLLLRANKLFSAK